MERRPLPVVLFRKVFGSTHCSNTPDSVLDSDEKGRGGGGGAFRADGLRGRTDDLRVMDALRKRMRFHRMELEKGSVPLYG